MTAVKPEIEMRHKGIYEETTANSRANYNRSRRQLRYGKLGVERYKEVTAIVLAMGITPGE